MSYYKTVDGSMTRIGGCTKGCWINCVEPSDSEINGLISDFNIEPDFFRAAMDEEESSHIDHEGDNTLIIIDIPVVEKEGKNITYTTMPLGIIATEENVITVSIKDNSIVKEFAGGAVKNAETNLKQIEKISNYVETELRASMKNSELLQLLDIEKSLVYFSSSLKGNQITLEKIMRGRVIKLYEDDQDLLEDVLIEVKQAIEMTTIYLNILSGTMDAFASVISNNLNIVMKVLASITLLFSIPAVISGFYGMNVSNIPMASFWFPTLITAVCMLIGYFILRRKNML